MPRRQEEVATFQTHVSVLKPRGIRQSRRKKKCTKGKLHLRSFLKVETYINNLFVL